MTGFCGWPAAGAACAKIEGATSALPRAEGARLLRALRERGVGVVAVRHAAEVA